MNKRIPSAEKRRLAERLRREAIESRPAFSESLHRRIVEAVNRAACETDERQSPIDGRNSCVGAIKRPIIARHYAPLAAACLLLGVVAVGLWLASLARQENSDVENIFVAQSATVDTLSIDDWTDQATVGIDRMVASFTLTPQADHLEHDARLAALALLERLPVNAEMMDAVAVDEKVLSHQ